MTGVEGDRRIRRPLLRRFGERIGFLISPEQRARREHEGQVIFERSRNEWELRCLRVEALVHSTASSGKKEYLLGFIDVDSHPDEVITFDPEHPWPGEVVGYTNQGNSVIDPLQAPLRKPYPDPRDRPR